MTRYIHNTTLYMYITTTGMPFSSSSMTNRPSPPSRSLARCFCLHVDVHTRMHIIYSSSIASIRERSMAIAMVSKSVVNPFLSTGRLQDSWVTNRSQEAAYAHTYTHTPRTVQSFQRFRNKLRCCAPAARTRGRVFELVPRASTETGGCIYVSTLRWYVLPYVGSCSFYARTTRRDD